MKTDTCFKLRACKTANIGKMKKFQSAQEMSRARYLSSNF